MLTAADFVASIIIVLMVACVAGGAALFVYCSVRTFKEWRENRLPWLPLMDKIRIWTMSEVDLYKSNFGTSMIDECPECEMSHISHINEECYQNEMLVGYWCVCPVTYNRFFATAEEVQSAKSTKLS